MAEEQAPRPVVPRFMQSDVHSVAPAVDTPIETRAVRPFLVTGGRTQADPSLRIESQLLANPDAINSYSFESASLLELTATPQSIAEASAHLKLPVGAIKVLAADLIADGALMVRQPKATTAPSTIRELIDAVSAL